MPTQNDEASEEREKFLQNLSSLEISLSGQQQNLKNRNKNQVFNIQLVPHAR